MNKDQSININSPLGGTKGGLLYDIFLSSRGVTTDTRKCEEGMMFFALKGATFNGNEFAQKALEAGCVCAVVDEERYATEGCVLVPDVLTALQEMAALHRRRLGTKVLQITGTNGKTTTKELCAAVLSRKYNVLYTEGNLNNHIGVPLTLLRLRPEHEIAVIETGANHPGEIAALTRIVQPDYGLITNVGRAHLEGFGGFYGVKRTKGELYDWLAEHGKPAFVNMADFELRMMAQDRDLQCIPYAMGHPAMADGLLVAMVCAEYDGVVERGHYVATNLVGAYNLPNVLAAVTVGRQFDVDEIEIYKAIKGYTPSNNRSQMVRTERNTLIVDAYNANPSSMALAIKNFATMDAEHKMMILGDMRELGAESEAEHRDILEQAQKTDVETLWLVGGEFAKVATDQTVFADVEAVKQALAANPVEGRTILIKGSNGTRLYQLPEVL